MDMANHIESRFGSLIKEVLILFLLTALYGLTASWCFKSIISAEGATWISPNGYTLVLLSVVSIAMFLLPLCSYRPAFVYMTSAFRHLKRINWRIALLGTLGALGLSLVFQGVSEYLIGLLPKSWGISTSDTAAEQLSSLLGVEVWYELPLIFLAFAIVPAIVEELFFRAYLQRRVIDFMPIAWHAALWCVSILFSLAHGSAVGFLSRLSIGLVLGYSYHRTHNIGLPIAIHGLNNSLVICALLAEHYFLN